MKLIQVVFKVTVVFSTEKFTTENDEGMWHYIVQPSLSSWTSTCGATCFESDRPVLRYILMLSSLCMAVFQMVFITWISRLKDDIQCSFALALLPDKPITPHLKILQ